MPIYSRTGRSGSAGLVARSCRFANPPSRARSRAPTGPRLPLDPRMLTYPQWANCFDQQPGPPVITSTLEASASATADLWLSASTRPVRCSIQGIALSGSIQGQGSLPGRADQLRRDLQKLYGQRHEIVDGQPAMALIHCLRKRIRDAGPHPDHGGLLNAELHRDGVGGLEPDVRLLATVSRIVSGRGLRRQQFGNTNQIVGDQIEHEIGGDTGYAAMFGLAHRAVLLAPAEDAFGHRPARLRNAVAFVPRGTSVDGALAALAGYGDAVVPRHMWCDVDSAQIGHMIGRVIGLVFAHRDAAAGLLGFGLEHYLRSAALGSPVGEGDPAGHRQPMPILHGSVAHIAELRLPPGGLAVKTAVGIAGARMRVVLALLSVEIGPAVFVAAAVLGAEALVRSSRLDQRSIHRKMLVRQQRLDLRVVEKLGHEFGKHLAVLQSVAVLREGGRVPDRVVGRKPHEPAIQEIVVQLLHQLAFRPDAVEHLEQQRAQQLFRRNRGTAFARVELPQATVQFAQYIAHKLPDLPQRMVRRHPRLGRDVRKQPTLIHKCAPHASPRRFVIEKLNHDTLAMARVFQQTARGNVVARVIENVTRETLEAFVREAVSTRGSACEGPPRHSTFQMAFVYKIEHPSRVPEEMLLASKDPVGEHIGANSEIYLDCILVNSIPQSHILSNMITDELRGGGREF